MVLLTLLALFLLNADWKKLERSWVMITSLKVSQVMDILGGVGEMGVLASGGEGGEISLGRGVRVPRTLGTLRFGDRT